MQTLPKISGEKLVKRFDLCSSTSIAEDGGTITGSLSYDKVKGAYFSGSTSYISYYPTSYLSGSRISFNIEFTPSFAHDDGVTHYLFSAYTTVVKMLVAKNSGSGISVYLGNGAGVFASTVSLATIWKVGQRNILVVSSTTGATNVWLNGVSLGTTNASAWAPLNSYTTAVIGAYYYGGINYQFAGYIHSISVHNTLLTATEAQDLYDNSTYNFINKSMGYWDFKSVADTVKDKSGRGDDATIYGCVFLNPGIYFDDTNDYLGGITSPTGTYTVSIHKKVLGIESVVFENDLTTWNKIVSSGDFGGNLYHLAWFPFVLTPTQQRCLTYLWRGNN